jgi:hypothetical protein
MSNRRAKRSPTRRTGVDRRTADTYRPTRQGRRKLVVLAQTFRRQAAIALALRGFLDVP